MAIYWTLVVDSSFEDLCHQDTNIIEVFRDLDHFGVPLLGSLIVLSCVACFAILVNRKGSIDMVVPVHCRKLPSGFVNLEPK